MHALLHPLAAIGVRSKTSLACFNKEKERLRAQLPHGGSIMLIRLFPQTFS